MHYTITIRVYQTDPSAWFEIVEKSIWHFANGGTWREVAGKQVLTMGASGTSGILRFNHANEYFIVALGVHNDAPWVDVSTGLPPDETACFAHKDYYTNGAIRSVVRVQNLKNFDVVSARGRKVKVAFNVAHGHNLECSIVIG